MVTMVEKVARAICREEYGSEDGGWENQIPAARAAIEAMREPDEAMVAAGVESWGFDYDANSTDGINANISGEYRAMIDAALKE